MGHDAQTTTRERAYEFNRLIAAHADAAREHEKVCREARDLALQVDKAAEALRRFANA